MYHSIKILIKQGELHDYFTELCSGYNNLMNVTHYYVRQCMTGLKKPTDELFPNEAEVLHNIEAALPAMNAPRTTKDGKLKQNKCNLKKRKKLDSDTADIKREKKLFEMPTSDSWFKGFVFWNRYFQVTENEDYYSLPGQVNQEAIKDALESWAGYFEALKQFKAKPSAFTGMPNIPHYRKSGGLATATLSNQICKVKHGIQGSWLILPKTKLTVNLGNAEFVKYKLKETKIKPCYGNFQVVLTFDDGIETPAVPTESKRVIGTDLGVSNIATISNNVGLNPIVIKGDVIKSYNQWFNKKNAQIQSDIDKKISNPINGISSTDQRDDLMAYRYRFFEDIFSKIAKFIIEYCKENDIDTIVVGKSNGWKNESNIGKEKNQAFCMIPHNLLVFQIQYRAEAAGIKCIVNEESYTSKASFLDNDDIPTYGKVEGKPKFSGRRIKRGLYKSKDGTLLNADVNGASNIIRKALPNAFDGVTDFSYLNRTVESKTFHDFAVLPKYKYSA